MTDEGKAIDSSPTPPTPRRPRRKLLRRGIGLVLAALLAWYVWGLATAPPPPQVDTAALDPAIARKIQQARLWVRLFPMVGLTWGRLGILFWAHEMAGPASSCFTQAERLQPGHFRWLYFHAVSLAPEDSRASLDLLTTALAHYDDSSPAPRLRLGRALVEQGRLDDAEAQFRRALDRHPDTPQAQLGLGQVAVLRGDLEAARPFLSSAAASSQTHKSAHSLLAELERRRGDSRAAEREQALAAALPEDPAWPDEVLQEGLQQRTGQRASIDRARVLMQHGDLAGAAALLQETTRDYPSSALPWFHLGKVQQMQQDHAAAEASLSRAIQLDPQMAEAHIQLGVVCMEQHEPHAAIRHYRDALKVQPDSALAHHNLGVALWQVGELSEARASFRAAIRRRPDLAESYLSLAELLAHAGSIDEARSQLQQCLQVHPGDARARALLNDLKRR